MIQVGSLPTHLALVARRLQVTGSNDSADTFLATSYITESVIKLIAIGLLAGVRKSSPRVAEKFDYELVRADGLGTWEKVIGDLTGQSIAGYVDSDLQGLITWLMQKRTRTEDEWARNVARNCSAIMNMLGLPDTELPSRLNIRFILSQLVRIRNKTKAHGAVGRDFFEQANPLYIAASEEFLNNCPLVDFDWYHSATRPQDNSVRAIHLKGPAPSHVLKADSEPLRTVMPGIYLRTHDKGHLLSCGPLLQANWECSAFAVPNGGYTSAGAAEFIDYGSGTLSRVNLPQFLKPPAPLPPSETEGRDAIDIYSNVFANLPSQPIRYVDRPKLEAELLRRIRDRNHTIVTLHGRGGIGKTSLALHICNLLAGENEIQYE